MNGVGAVAGALVGIIIVAFWFCLAMVRAERATYEREVQVFATTFFGGMGATIVVVACLVALGVGP